MQSSVAVTVSRPPSKSRWVIPMSSACVNGRPSISPCTMVLRRRSSGLARFSSIFVRSSHRSPCPPLHASRRRSRSRRLRADRVVAPHEELRQVFLGQTQEREEDRRRQGRGEIFMEIALAAVDERVDDLVDEFAGLGFEVGHPLGRELRVEDAPVLRVLGRVDRERDERARRYRC